MRHDAHGYWIEEAGLEDADAPSAPDRRHRGRRRRDRRRLHRALVRLVAQTARPRRPGRPARGRSLRLRAERPQRRLRQLDVVQPADDAGDVRRRSGARDGPRGRCLGDRDRRVVRGPVGRRLVHPRRLHAGLDRTAFRRQLGARRRRLRASSGSAAGSRSSTAPPRSAAAPHRCSAAPPSTASARPSSRRGSPPGCGSPARDRGRDPRGHDGPVADRAGGGVDREDRRRSGQGRARRSSAPAGRCCGSGRSAAR